MQGRLEDLNVHLPELTDEGNDHSTVASLGITNAMTDAMDELQSKKDNIEAWIRTGKKPDSLDPAPPVLTDNKELGCEMIGAGAHAQVFAVNGRLFGLNDAKVAVKVCADCKVV